MVESSREDDSVDLLVKMENEDQVEMTRWKRKSDVQGRWW